MTAQKMHPDEVETDVSLVERLIADQFPQWANLSVTPVRSAGTDNAIYRLGEDKCVRLPRIAATVAQVEKEQQWLPRLAPHLPLEIPVPLAEGIAGEGYPFRWSVYQWLEGANATLDRISNLDQFAVALAEFIAALQKVDATDGPPAGEQNFYRGAPLRLRDAPARAAIVALNGMIDTEAVIAIWEDALNAPIWTNPPVWIHGDLQSGNLLCRDGKLHAVIDFGGMGVGDPACDLIVAWNLLPASARKTFRETLTVDTATWRRGRGWALSIALIALPYYTDTNPVLAEMARFTINAVLNDATD